MILNPDTRKSIGEYLTGKDLTSWRNTTKTLLQETPKNTPLLAVCTQTFHKQMRVLSLSFSHTGLLNIALADQSTLAIYTPEKSPDSLPLRGHTNEVLSATFNHGATQLASGSKDKTVNVWDTKTGTCIQTFSQLAEPIHSLAFSPNNEILTGGSSTEELHVWNLATAGYISQKLSSKTMIASLAFSHNGGMLAGGSYVGKVFRWDRITPSLTSFINPSDRVDAVTFNNEGTILASGSFDGKINLWDPKTLKSLRILSSHTSWVSFLQFNPNSTKLASGADQGDIKLWNPESGTCLQTLLGHTKRVTSIAFNHQGNILASGAYNGESKLWDLASDIETVILDREPNSLAYAVMMSCSDMIDRISFSLHHESDTTLLTSTIPEVVHRIEQLPSAIQSEIYTTLKAALSKNLKIPPQTNEGNKSPPSIQDSFRFFFHTLLTLSEKEDLNEMKKKANLAGNQAVSMLLTHYSEKETSLQRRRAAKTIAGIGIVLLALMATNWTAEAD